MALPEYMPEVTFIPQCSRCKVDACKKRWLELYRVNYIKCHDRTPDERFKKWWEPQEDSWEHIKNELANNRDAYTPEELEEAEATYRRLNK